jgi:hypothetical protein
MKLLISLALLFILSITSACDELSDFLSPISSSTTNPPTVTTTTPTTTTSSTTETTSSTTTTSTTETTSSAPVTSISTVIATKNISTHGVTFNYPDYWELLASNGPNVLASFRDKGTGAFIQVAETEIGFDMNDKDLQIYQQAWVNEIMVGQPISEAFLGGYPGFTRETLFKDETNRWRVVSIATGIVVFDFSVTSPPEKFVEANKDFNILLNSFHLK